MSPMPCFITCIIDSIDAAKHAYPRSRAMSSKEFANWSRPRLTNTTMLIHGHLALVALSPEGVSSNSSRTAEIVSHGLTLLQRKGLDLRQCFLHLQADNCTKELKNNTLLRLCGMTVALHRLKGCQLAFLSSGHSHEDIDAHFAVVRLWFQRYPELWTPAAFKTCVEEFFAVSSNRPHEPTRTVPLLTQFHDWSFAWQVASFFLAPAVPFHVTHTKEALPGPLQQQCPCEGHRWPWGATRLFFSTVCRHRTGRSAPAFIFYRSVGALPGLERDDVDHAFWDRRSAPESASDVVLRSGVAKQRQS